MKNRNETDSIKELIVLQKQKYDYELILLKEQFHLAYESLKPINLIKNAVHEVNASPEIKNDLIANAIGFGTGFISKKLLVNKSDNPVKRILGTVIQFAVAHFATKHTHNIKAIGRNLLNRFLAHK